MGPLNMSVTNTELWRGIANLALTVTKRSVARSQTTNGQQKLSLLQCQQLHGSLTPGNNSFPFFPLKKNYIGPCHESGIPLQMVFFLLLQSRKTALNGGKSKAQFSYKKGATFLTPF
jgi:hypothetical protein